MGMAAATLTVMAGSTWRLRTTTANQRLFSTTSGSGLFADDTASIGLTAPTRCLLGFGIAFVDVNNDGALDLVSANGHVNDYRPVFPGKCPLNCCSAGPDGRLKDVHPARRARFARFTSGAAWPRATSTTMD